MSTRAIVKTMADEMAELRAENDRLRASVKLAVERGLALEEAYNDAQRQYHNYQDWEDEQWNAIQAARDALCATPNESGEP